jgi:hypothetical protein
MTPEAMFPLSTETRITAKTRTTEIRSKTTPHAAGTRLRSVATVRG